MQTIPSSTIRNLRRNAKNLEIKPAPENETKSERVERLYKAPGGPLIGWLYDECRKRNTDFRDMAAALGVTYGYINQLRSGLRKTESISHDFAHACSRYLGIPTVVVKLLAGSIRLTDFQYPEESEAQAIDRSLRLMMEDPKVKAVLPAEPGVLTLEAKRALVMMYSEVSSADFFHTRELPNMVFWLQRAAALHDEAEFQAAAGHRDNDVR